MAIKHATQSVLADDPSKEISKDEWNEDHSVTVPLGSPSYTIYKSGATYYAMDQNGNDDYSNADPVVVIESAWTALSSGGSIYCVAQNGETWEWLTQLNSQANNVKIYSDWGLTHSPQNNMDATMISITHDYIKLYGLHLDCNKGNMASGHGIYTSPACSHLTIDYCWILNTKDDCIQTDYSWHVTIKNCVLVTPENNCVNNGSSNHVKVLNNYCDSPGEYAIFCHADDNAVNYRIIGNTCLAAVGSIENGIRLSSTSTSYVYDFIISENYIDGFDNSGRAGIKVNAGRRGVVSYNMVKNNYWGIDIEAEVSEISELIEVHNNDVYFSDGVGIHVYSNTGIVQDIDIHNNLVFDNGDIQSDSGIYVNQNSATTRRINVHHNTLRDNNQYGVGVVAGCTAVTVKDNQYENNGVGAINDLGTNTITHEINLKISNPNASMGQHQGIQMLDGVDTLVGFEIDIPAEFQELVTAVAVVLQTDDAGSGDMVWSVATDAAAGGQAYNTHEDTDSGTDTITQNNLIEIDVAPALTNISGGDWIGFEFTRDGDHASDTLDETCLFIGLKLRYV